MIEKLDLNDLGNGVVAERIATAWQDLLQNMQDPNVSYKPKRKLIVTLTCEQDEKRQKMEVVADVAVKLAPSGGVSATFATGMDLKSGEAYAQEYQTVDVRQIKMEQYEDHEIDPETGEIMEDDHEERVIDLRKVR